VGNRTSSLELAVYHSSHDSLFARGEAVPPGAMRQIEVVCVPVKIGYTCEQLAFLNRAAATGLQDIAAGNAYVSQDTLRQSLS
jgi:hypothetical protein